MKAYVLVDIDVEEPGGFMNYATDVAPLISKHGGKYLVRGGVPEMLLGDSQSPQHVVLLEFPSREAADTFFEERAAVGLKDLFESSTHSRILLADGVEEA